MAKQGHAVTQSKEKPVLDRDYIETLVLEKQEEATTAVTLSNRKKAAAVAKLLEDILNATR